MKNIFSKLDRVAFQQWELAQTTTDIVAYSVLEKCLMARIMSLEAYEGTS